MAPLSSGTASTRAPRPRPQTSSSALQPTGTAQTRAAHAATGAEENRLVRFIVRASQCGDSEWGLPPWTPYPSIDSAAAEFAALPSRSSRRPNIPLVWKSPIARVEDAVGNRVGVNGSITAASFQNHPSAFFRGVGSVFLPAAKEPNTISTAQIQTLAAPKKIVIEGSTTWRTVPAGTISITNWATRPGFASQAS